MVINPLWGDLLAARRRTTLAMTLGVAASAIIAMPGVASAGDDDASVHITPGTVKAGEAATLTAHCPDGKRVTEVLTDGVFAGVRIPSPESKYTETVTITADMTPGTYTVNLTCLKDFFDIPERAKATVTLRTPPTANGQASTGLIAPKLQIQPPLAPEPAATTPPAEPAAPPANAPADGAEAAPPPAEPAPKPTPPAKAPAARAEMTNDSTSPKPWLVAAGIVLVSAALGGAYYFFLTRRYRA